MSNEKIAAALLQRFDKHRIVFWYDDKQELLAEYESLDLPDIEKIQLDNNEFTVKHHVLRAKPEQKFLIYKAESQPDDIDNWLLDVQLAHCVFNTDQASIWLADVNLGIEFLPLAKQHSVFFNAATRREELKNSIKADYNHSQVQMAMLSICADSKTQRLDAVLEQLLQEQSKADLQKIQLIERCNLQPFLWEQMQRIYNYSSQEPSIKDFAISLFQSCYKGNLRETASLNNEAFIFLNRWKDSRKFSSGFEFFSDLSARVLNIESDLNQRSTAELIETDFFRLIDLKIISDLAKIIINSTQSNIVINKWIRQRKLSYWHAEFYDLYEALEYAANFIDLFKQTDLSSKNLLEAFNKYTKNWYLLDQLYRKFIYHSRKSAQPSLLSSLKDKIENIYTNQYLLALGDNLQTYIDELPSWNLTRINRQDSFFKNWVQPFVDKSHRVCVIISDAFRYEIADELVSLIRREDRYSADLQSMLSMLPSYTQLGMAALLPNKQLELKDDSTVLVDGFSSSGTENRNRILQNIDGVACTYEDFIKLDKTQSREFIKSANLVYIYHNRIDHTGDKIQSEGLAFKAAQETFDDLIKLVKKLSNANLSNILITSDHGFIYQDRELSESDYLSEDVSFKKVLFRNRRFVIGTEASPKSALHTFSSKKLGLEGDLDVQIPRSINRLRLKGSGSRFVHGGACLQEVVVPVVKINKKRISDIRKVDVELVRSGRSVITTGVLALNFYQTEAVTDKVQPRILEIGVYSQTGELISNKQEIIFNFQSDNPREREQKVNLILSRKVDELNGQDVVLRMREKNEGITHLTEYDSVIYSVQKSFTTDFDL